MTTDFAWMGAIAGTNTFVRLNKVAWGWMGAIVTSEITYPCGYLDPSTPVGMLTA